MTDPHRASPPQQSNDPRTKPRIDPAWLFLFVTVVLPMGLVVGVALLRS